MYLQKNHYLCSLIENLEEFMDISVIVPLYNEAESLPVLHDWIVRVMRAHNYTYEIIFINDGSTDASWESNLAPHLVFSWAIP